MLLCSSFHMMSVGHIPVPGAWHLSVSRAARPATPPEKPTRSMLSSWSRACHPAPCPNLSSQLNASMRHRQASPGLHILLSLLALEQPSEISGHTPDPGRPCPWVPPLCSPPVPTSWLVVCLCGPQAHSNRRPPPPGTWGITYIFLPRLCLGFQHFSGRKDRQVCPRESSGNGACVPPPSPALRVPHLLGDGRTSTASCVGLGQPWAASSQAHFIHSKCRMLLIQIRHRVCANHGLRWEDRKRPGRLRTRISQQGTAMRGGREAWHPRVGRGGGVGREGGGQERAGSSVPAFPPSRGPKEERGWISANRSFPPRAWRHSPCRSGTQGPGCGLTSE